MLWITVWIRSPENHKRGEQSKIQVPTQAIRQEEPSSSLVSLFLSRPCVNWTVSIHIGEDKLLYWVCGFKCAFHLKISSQTLSEIMFCQISGHPEIQSNCHLKLTIPPHFPKVLLARIQTVRADVLYNYSCFSVLCCLTSRRLFLRLHNTFFKIISWQHKNRVQVALYFFIPPVI